jgi:hypothetical protein
VKRLLLISFLLAAHAGFSQRDSLSARKWIVGGTNAALWGGSTFLLNEIWYKDYPRSAFHPFNDASNWRFMDKSGHAFTAYQLSTAEYAAWRWAGVNEHSATWLSGGISWGYLMTVEVLDGFSSEWGFSWADVTANTAGSGLFVAQQLAWNQQRIYLKFGYRPSPYADLRPDVLGSTFSERLLKDYNAQSYWLCVSPALFLPNANGFPRWIQLSFGYSTDQMLKGDSDLYSIDGFTYRARSEYAISLDIDWSQLPIKRPWLRKIVRPLNALKIPFPAVFWRGGVCYVGML